MCVVISHQLVEGMRHRSISVIPNLWLQYKLLQNTLLKIACRVWILVWVSKEGTQRGNSEATPISISSTSTKALWGEPREPGVSVLRLPIRAYVWPPPLWPRGGHGEDQDYFYQVRPICVLLLLWLTKTFKRGRKRYPGGNATFLAQCTKPAFLVSWTGILLNWKHPGCVLHLLDTSPIGSSGVWPPLKLCRRWFGSGVDLKET